MKRLGRAVLRTHRVADVDQVERFDVANQIANLPSSQGFARSSLGSERADFEDFMDGVVGEEFEVIIPIEIGSGVSFLGSKKSRSPGIDRFC